MYKVLIVDDEILDLMGLQQHIDWEELDMEIVSSANNGFVALEYLTKNHVDILVSDINMPIMTGLELAREALKHKSNLRIVFVSGYSEFQYAKQAITMNANGYVLKPIDDEELFLVLQSVKIELDKEIKIMDWEKNETINQLLNGQAVTLDLQKNQGLSVAVIEIDNTLLKPSPFIIEHQTVVLDDLQKLIVEMLLQEKIVYFCKSDSIRIVVILEDGAPAVRLNNLIKRINENQSWSVTIGLGNIVFDLKELPASYQDAKEALSYKMFHGKGIVIQTADIKNQTAQQTKKLDDVLESLFISLNNYQLVKVDEHMEDLFLLVKIFKDKYSVYAFMLHVISQLDFRLRNVNEDLFQILDLDFKKLDVLFHFETIVDIQWWLRSKMIELSEWLQQKKLTKNRKLIDDIQKYIMDKLEEELTLKDVAMFFSFSPNYLGHLFKEETGNNFSNFVIGKRMEHASRLLQAPSMKIYEVANRLGYKKLSSFNRQFKEQFGLTPSDYRKQG
ncbi:response regulator [Paenibacillus psychroresistens]|uniref:Response regulator n=1 Tax=Paenibacillus psychroresistens TaxID=1778678 RepID=A0A6B8RT39_9BACL|nr:response regulator [Paenibacillus psychroresistens]QGQ98368.1 response regulator [Paenibacillus psychroresistens]